MPDCDGTMDPNVELTVGPTDRPVKVAVVPWLASASDVVAAVRVAPALRDVAAQGSTGTTAGGADIDDAAGDAAGEAAGEAGAACDINPGHAVAS
jgi:hypothetical protein